VLHWICALGDLQKANAVLSIQGVEVNAQDNAGWTALMIAGISLRIFSYSVSSGKEDIAERLLEIPDTDVVIQNRNGATALYQISLHSLMTRHYAASKNRIHVSLLNHTYPSPQNY